MGEKRRCKECGTEFTPKNKVHRYCSERCRDRASSRRSYRARPEYHRAATNRYHRQHRCELYEKQQRRVKAKPGPKREGDRRFYQRHRERIRQRTANFYREHREEILEKYRRRWLLRQLLKLKVVLAEKFKMSEIIRARDNALAVLREMTTEQLKQELVDRLGLTAESLLRTACLVAVLEERGEDLSGLKIGLLDHLRQIAQGKLLPEIVVKFAGNSRTIKQLAELPLVQQQRILDGADPVPILRLNGQAERKHSPVSHVGQGNVDLDYRRFQQPQEIVGEASPRDVAEHLFRLAIRHREPSAVVDHLRRFLEEWQAGGKRQAIVLREVGGE